MTCFDTSCSITFSASSWRRRPSRTSASVRLRRVSSCLNCSSLRLPLALVKARVELGGRHLDLQRRRLRDEEVLEDEIVEHRQLGGDRLLGGERLVRIAVAAKGLLRGVLRDRPAVDDGPGIGGDRRLAGRFVEPQAEARNAAASAPARSVGVEICMSRDWYCRSAGQDKLRTPASSRSESAASPSACC